MPYASVQDVEALTRSRKLGVGNNPTVQDVETFLTLAEGDINGILSLRGYALPPPSSATVALGILRSANAQGSLARLETSAPSSVIKKEAIANWDSALKLIETSDQFTGIPKDVERMKPRGPGVTRAPTTAEGNEPYFDRHMEF